MPSESTDLVRELVEGGLNYADIGQALGRDRSLVRQVGIGAKPGNNLRAALAELRDRLAGVQAGRHQAARAATVPAPPRRQTAAGKPAAVRRRTRHEGPHHSTQLVKRQASQHGATALGKALDRAADAGRQAAVTVGFDRAVTVTASSPGAKHARTGAGGSVEFKLGDAEEVREEVDQEYGGNFAAYVAAKAAEAGYISGPADERETVAHMTSLELRTF